MSTKVGSSSVFSFAGGFKHFRLPSLPLVVHVKENKPVIKLQQVSGRAGDLIRVVPVGCAWL